MSARRTLVAVGLLIGMAFLLPVQVCRDWAWIDRNTGSRKGYREWALGWRSGSWYQESPIESFMRSNNPAGFRQDWVSYAGTGRNLLGRAMLSGHGRPGPILLLRPEAIADYCRMKPDTEKRRLYDLFSSGDEAAIREQANQIFEPGTNSVRTD